MEELGSSKNVWGTKGKGVDLHIFPSGGDVGGMTMFSPRYRKMMFWRLYWIYVALGIVLPKR